MSLHRWPVLSGTWYANCKHRLFMHLVVQLRLLCFPLLHHSLHCAISAVSQCKLVSGWRLRKWISVLLNGPMWLTNDFPFYVVSAFVHSFAFSASAICKWWMSLLCVLTWDCWETSGDVLYIVQAPEVYLTVWIAVDAVSAVTVVLFWIIQRYVCTLYHCQSSALCLKCLTDKNFGFYVLWCTNA